MSHYNELTTHQEFIDMDNYGGATPFSASIQELLCGKVFNHFQLLQSCGDNPNSTVHIGQFELLDKNTNQILLKIRFGDPHNPEPPLVGHGLYVEHVHSDVYAQDALVGFVINQLFKHCSDLMFVRISRSINLSRYSCTLNSHEHRFFTRPNTRTVQDYIPDDMRKLMRVNARELLIAWGATDDQIHDITMDDDMKALSDIQEIQDMLDVIFNNPIDRNRFISMVNHNPPFLGLTPIEYLTENPARSIEIAEHIRSIGVPW